MAADMSSGTGAGLVAFLNWTIERSELPRATASAMRTASTKVLSVEEGWEDLDLRTLDTDALNELIRRFNIRSASDYSEQSLAVYGQRFLKSVQMYLTKLDGGDWRPRNGRAPSASRNGTPRNGAGKRSPSVSPTPPVTANDPEDSATNAPPSAPPPVVEADGLIEYPFPVRPGLRARLNLPEDLTTAEADRVAAFIKTLAFEKPAD